MKVDLQLVYFGLCLVSSARLRPKLSPLGEQILEKDGQRGLFLLENELIDDFLSYLESNRASSAPT